MNPAELPELRAVFDNLRSGRHVCGEDGSIYRALVENEEEFRMLFKALGFTLVRHGRDFFYFRGTDSFSTFGSRISVFFFILVEWLAEKGEGMEEVLFTRTFTVPELPHFQRERYRKYMAEAGTEDEDSLAYLLTRMERLGFISRGRDGSFTFRHPAYRLLDLCIEVLGTDGAEES